VKEPKVFVEGIIQHRKSSKVVVDEDGRFTILNDGKTHVIDGIINDFGYICHWVNGKLHRLDGPAIENINLFYIDGKRCYTQQEHAIAAFLWMSEHEKT
jgi:hypothetical protein